MERINIGIIGLNFGETIIKELKSGINNQYFNVAAVCDIKKNLVDENAIRYNAKPYYSIDALLNDPKIEAIGLFTPPNGRADKIKQIIRAGKNIITTKPFETDWKKAKLVLEEAHELGCVVHTNSPSVRLSPFVEQVKIWVDEYNLGVPIGARSDTWVNYKEKADGGWYDDPSLCPVAPVLRLGIYIINDLISIFGSANKVTTLSSRLLTGRPTVDNAQLGIMFNNGSIANIFCTFCVDDGQRYNRTMILNYERGTIYYNVVPRYDNTESIKTFLVLKDRNGSKRIIQKDTIINNSGQYHWDIFYNSIKGNPWPVKENMFHIVEGIKILQAAAQAEKSGCVVELE